MTTPVINQDYSEKIKARFKDIMIDLLPPDQLDSYIEKEIKAFFEDTTSQFTITETTERSYSSNKVIRTFGVSCSPFRLLIWQELNKLVMVKVSALTESEELKASVYSSVEYDGYIDAQATLGERWEKKLDGLVMSLAKDMFRSMFTQAVLSAKSDTIAEVQNHVDQQHGGVWYQPK